MPSYDVGKLFSGIGPGKGVNPGNNKVTPLTIIKSVPVLQWVRGDLGITLATGVSAWADQSGNNHNFAQATGAKQPVYNPSDSGLNFQPTLSATAVNSTELVNTTLPLGQNLWISGIGKETSYANAALWGSRSGQPETTDLYDAAGAGNVSIYSGTAVNSGIILPLNTWQRMEALYSTTAAYIKVGGRLTGGALNSGTNTATGASIFSTTGAAFWNGAIAERIVTQGKPSPAEIAALDNYYLSRYGFDVVYGNPLSIFGTSSVLQWVRADKGITIATGVSAWADQTANARNYTQATGSAQPVYNSSDGTLNGLPSITFDGSNDSLTSAFNLPAPGTTPTCALGLAKYLSFSGTACLISDNSNVGGGCLLSSGANLIRSQSGIAGTSVTCPTNSWARYRADWSNNAGDIFRYGANQTTGNVGNSIPAGRAIGSAGTIAYGNVAVFEVVYLNRIPSAAEMTAYDNYLTTLTNGAVVV